MFSLFHVKHVHVSEALRAWEQEFDEQELVEHEAPEAGSEHRPATTEELAVFGLVEAGREGPASLASFDRLSAGERLAAIGLVSAGKWRPSGQESLADAAPYDVLGHLGLLG